MSMWRFTSGFAFLVWGGVVLAAPPADRSPASHANKIVITSQSLVFKNQENKAVFDGKVLMTKVGFIMHADHMVVHFEGTPDNSVASQKPTEKSAPQARSPGPELPTFGSRAVSVIEATGNVVMEQGAKTAKSKKAVYSQRDEKLVLTGDPEVWEVGYHITGVRMTMFLNEDRSVVEGSRVIINDADTGTR